MTNNRHVQRLNIPVVIADELSRYKGNGTLTQYIVAIFEKELKAKRANDNNYKPK